MIITNGGGGDVWVMDLSTGVMTPMTRDGGSSQRSTEAWAPDSKRLAVMTPGGGVAEVIVASGQSTELTKDSLFPEDYLPDGSSILCQNDPATRFSLLSLGEGHAVRPVVTTPYRQAFPRLSPDGKYVAYNSSETAGNEVYVAAFPSLSVKRRVSANGGNFPVWTKRGKVIAYSTIDGTVMEVEVRTTPELEVGERKPLFKVAQALNRFGVTADGERFLTAELVAQKGPAAMELTVVLGWLGAMRR
jgi:Tol biopolymer transport system component